MQEVEKYKTLFAELQSLARITTIHDVIFQNGLNKEEARILYLYYKLFFENCKKKGAINVEKFGSKYEISRMIAAEAQEMKQATGERFITTHTNSTYEQVAKLLRPPLVEEMPVSKAAQLYDIQIDGRKAKVKKKIFAPSTFLQITPQGRAPYSLNVQLLFYPTLGFICLQGYPLPLPSEINPMKAGEQVQQWTPAQDARDAVQYRIRIALDQLGISPGPLSSFVQEHVNRRKHHDRK